MKRIVYPALLCVAFASLLSGYFSTDFSRGHSFLLPERARPTVLRLEPAAPLIGDLPHNRATILPRPLAPQFRQGATSPESAVK